MSAGTPFYHVGPILQTKEGWAFQTFSVEEGMNTRSFSLHSLAATERGAMMRGFRMLGVEYLSYPDARSFGVSLRDLRANQKVKP